MNQPKSLFHDPIVYELANGYFFRDGELGLYPTMEDARKGVNRIMDHHGSSKK